MAMHRNPSLGFSFCGVTKVGLQNNPTEGKYGHVTEQNVYKLDYNMDRYNIHYDFLS